MSDDRLARLSRVLYYLAVPTFVLLFFLIGIEARFGFSPSPEVLALTSGLLIIGFSLTVGAIYLASAASSKAQALEISSANPPREPSQKPTTETLSPYGLTKLDLFILRNLGKAKSEDDLARATNVDAAVIRSKFSLLIRHGYVTENRELTEKGYLMVNEDWKESPVTHREKEILTREVVRIPCRHCGSLVDQTATKCPNCGAPLTR